MKRIRTFFSPLWISLQLILFATASYRVIFCEITASERIWLWILFLSESALCLITIKKQKITRLQYLSALEPVFFTVISIGQIEITSGASYNFHSIPDLFWNIILFLFCYCVLYLLCRNKKAVVILLNMAIVILSIANHYFFEFRSKPLQLSDILLAKTAATVLGNYSFKINFELFYFVLIEIGVIFYCIKMSSPGKMTRSARHALITATFLMFLGISNYKPQINYWNMAEVAETYGYLNSFSAYAREDLKPQKPDDYSPAYVKEILSQYEERTPQSDLPNIIVIMDEAFADLPSTYAFETEPDGMPFFHSMEENTIKGNLMVSVFGGSTANTEWEFLTGNSMALLNGGKNPYQQYLKSAQASIASHLKKFNYQTIAFHPYYAENYSRDSVYPLLGFDQFISINDKLNYNNQIRDLMSDDSDFKNLIDIYENRDKSRPLFLFNVTMQNHGGYSENESSVDVTVTPKNKELQYASLLEYLSLVRETDSAFEDLLDYFSNVSEKIVILIFGDHQPGLSDEIFDKFDSSAYTPEKRQKYYTVPFYLWANFELAPKSNVLASPGYLRAILLDAANVPCSPYDMFLLNCHKTYPAVNFIGYYDQERNLSEFHPETDPELLKQYRMLQYANLFDHKLKGAF